MASATMTEGFKKYILVTKPGIVGGNVVTAMGAYFLASQGQAEIVHFLITILGISLVVASGCVFNNWLDRDLDRRMARTRNRILARGLMSSHVAVLYGLGLGTGGFILLATMVNLLSLVIVFGGFVIYVGLYTLYLKRRSRFATIFGSLAGAAPPLAAYCAVSNRFDLGAAILLSIFTLWQIPHSYAFAISHGADYRSASIPVLPVSRGVAVANKQNIAYIIVFTVAAMLLSFCGYTGHYYLAAAAVLGLLWLLLAWLDYRNPDDPRWAERVFVFSILQIIGLSFMMAIDSGIAPEQTVAGWREPALHFRDHQPHLLTMSHFSAEMGDDTSINIILSSPANLEEVMVTNFPNDKSGLGLGHALSGGREVGFQTVLNPSSGKK